MKPNVAATRDVSMTRDEHPQFLELQKVQKVIPAVGCGTGDGVFAVERHHRIILWNQAAKPLLGYKAHEVLGKYCHDVFQGRDPNGLLVCSKQCSHFRMAKSLRLLPHKNL